MGKSVDIENKKMRKDVNVLPHRTAQPIGILAYWPIIYANLAFPLRLC